MTTPLPPDHLDDEGLSALLDDAAVGAGAGAHVGTCTVCSARLEALRSAREAVASAVVAPLPAATLDGLVSTALGATPEAAISGSGGSTVPAGRVVGIDPGRRRGRRLQTPPPAWVLGAVAALALVVGLAGVLRAGGGGGDDLASEVSTDAAEARMESSGAGGASVGADLAAADPEVVVRDLGDVADAATLAAALDGPAATTTRTARATAGGAAGAAGAADDQAATDEEAAATAPPAAAPPPAAAVQAAPAAEGPPDRARCRAEAERIGAGRFSTLLSAATLRWAGQPAEVLVFSLVEPAGGFRRQALVLARPGCALLADPRW